MDLFDFNKYDNLYFFAVDKFKAIKGKWRISEDVLLGLSFVGGSIGGLIAMNIFSHKTKKDSFKWGLKIMLILHVTIISYMVTSLI